ncbi:ABC transporter permease subunit, partial [Chryseobacterium indologenes]
IFFLGFSCISAERENNTLKVLLSQGVKWKELLAGKILGLFTTANLLYIPVVILSVVIWLSLTGFHVSLDELTRLFWVILAYFVYFFIICMVCVLVSATSKTS